MTAETTIIEIGQAGDRAATAGRVLDDLGAGGRVDLMRAIADAVAAAATELATTADRETGLGMPRLLGEAARTASQFRLMADVLVEGSLLDIAIDSRIAAGEPGGPRPELRRTSRPIGVVAVYAASNFPLAFGVAGTDTAAALAAGCAVIAKAHPYQTETAALSVEIIRRVAVGCRLPADILQVVYGFEAGRSLITAPAVAAAAFTGSFTGGRALFDLACARVDPIPFFGELGSVNPVVVTAGAARDRGSALGAELATSILLGSGQFCTQPGLILLPDSPDGAVIESTLAVHVAAQPDQVLLGGPLAAEYASSTAGLGSVPNASLLATGARPGPGQPRAAAAQLWRIPAADVLAHPESGLREYFGPAAIVVPYRDLDEAEAILRAVPGCLSISVHSADDEDASGLYQLAADRAGRVLGAGVPTGVAVSWAQHHGGPWPATTYAGGTSVGAGSIRRFLRPVVYQDVPERILPPELRDSNPLGLVRRIDGRLTTEPIS